MRNSAAEAIADYAIGRISKTLKARYKDCENAIFNKHAGKKREKRYIRVRNIAEKLRYCYNGRNSIIKRDNKNYNAFVFLSDLLCGKKSLK